MADSNRETVIGAWKAFTTRDPVEIERFFSDDAERIAPAGNATAVALGVADHMVGRTAISHFVAHDFGRLFVADSDIAFANVFADGEAVIVEERMRATLANGRRYDNAYCFVFTMKDGKIVQVREYMDTLKAQRMVFGDESERRLVTSGE